MNEDWRRCWRDGFAPLLSDAGLAALRDALGRDAVELVQGCTVSPPPWPSVAGWPAEAACAVGYCGWLGDGLETVGEVNEYFAQMCFEADRLLDMPAGCRWFLNFFDDTPRREMIALLLPEVEREIERRGTSDRNGSRPRSEGNVKKRDELSDPKSCMSRAHDDEWTFVLLGRDAAAPATIRFWVAERIRLGKNTMDDPQIKEALEAADSIDAGRASGN